MLREYLHCPLYIKKKLFLKKKNLPCHNLSRLLQFVTYISPSSSWLTYLVTFCTIKTYFSKKQIISSMSQLTRLLQFVTCISPYSSWLTYLLTFRSTHYFVPHIYFVPIIYFVTVRDLRLDRSKVQLTYLLTFRTTHIFCHSAWFTSLLTFRK